jgi:type VI protein secretion system component Hcp
LPAFMRIDSQRGPVPGDIDRNGFKNWFEIVSWSPDRQRSGSKFQNLDFAKRMDSASIRISDCSANGTVIQAYFEVTRQEEQGAEYVYLKIKMTDAIISAYSVSTGGAESAQESFSISASAVSIQYLGPPDPGDEQGPRVY